MRILTVSCRANNAGAFKSSGVSTRVPAQDPIRQPARRPQKPRVARFGFAEKAEYWALIWGSVIMVITGFFLWFDNWAVKVVTKGFVDLMLVIHFYEAVLATLAVAIWHGYGTVFNPGVYPGNPSWISTAPVGTAGASKNSIPLGGSPEANPGGPLMKPFTADAAITAGLPR